MPFRIAYTYQGFDPIARWASPTSMHVVVSTQRLLGLVNVNVIKVEHNDA